MVERCQIVFQATLPSFQHLRKTTSSFTLLVLNSSKKPVSQLPNDKTSHQFEKTDPAKKKLNVDQPERATNERLIAD